MDESTNYRIYVLIGRKAGFSSGLWQGISSYARTNDRWILRAGSFEDIERCASIFKSYSGIIAQIGTQSQAEMLTEIGVPIVNVGTPMPNPSLPQVLNNDWSIGKVVAEFFIDRGYRSFAAVGHSQLLSQRFDGFCNRLLQSGIPLESIHYCNFTPTTDEALLKQWMSNLPKPAALLAFNDYTAELLTTIAGELGLTIPGKIALMGVDNDECICRSIDPTLTSVQTSPERIGFEAARTLNDILSEGVVLPFRPRRIDPVGIVERQSTDHIAADDPQIIAALKYIYSHLDDDFDIVSVCSAAEIGRRRLEQKFHLSFGRSPLTVFRQLQVNRAKQLLITTDLTVAQVAERSGFSSPAHFRFTFRENSGISPAKFRELNLYGKVRVHDTNKM